MPDLILNKKDLSGRAAVYVAWGRMNTCLYVGMTSQGLLRPYTNPTLRERWDELIRLTIEWCANSDVARDREKSLIRQLHPKWNKNGLRVPLSPEERRERKEQQGNLLQSQAWAVLEQHKGDKAAAAAELKVSRATFYRRLGPQKAN